VFLEPLEARFDAPRALVSLTYSLALVALTLAVLVGHKLFALWWPAKLISMTCLVAAIGATIAAYGTSLTIVWLGYSLLFGGANGLGYAFGLQISAQANPGREGMSMGLVTASYAVGATISPALFTFALSIDGFRAAMLGLMISLVLIAPLCARLMATSRAHFHTVGEVRPDRAVPRQQIALLWVGYGAGVAAGLMAIGHAAGIAKSVGLVDSVWVAPMIVALCNMCGSFAGGWLADRTAQGKLLMGLALLSGATLFLLTLSNSVVWVLSGLGMVGFTYGAIIAVYPATIAKLCGVVEGARIYGMVFTAWGTAGLFAPWLAGALFDRTGGYAGALLIAALFSLFSAGAAFVLFRRRQKYQ